MSSLRFFLVTIAVAAAAPAATSAQSIVPADAGAPAIRIDAATLPAAEPARALPTQQAKKDSLRNGAIVGAIVGGIYGAIGWGRVIEGAGAKAGIIMAYTAGGALIGAGIDALHNRQPEPGRRTTPPPRPTVRFSFRF